MSTCNTSCSNRSVSNKVVTGPYFGFSRAEMQTEYERYKAEMQKSGSRLTGASISGQSFSYGPRGDWSLTTWANNIRGALSQVDPGFQPTTGQIVTRFGSSC